MRKIKINKVTEVTINPHLGYKAVNDCGDYYEVLVIEDAEQNHSLFNAIKQAMNFPSTIQQYKNYYVSMENIDDDGIDVVRVNSDKTFTFIEVSPYQLTEDYIEKN